MRKALFLVISALLLGGCDLNGPSEDPVGLYSLVSFNDRALPYVIGGETVSSGFLKLKGDGHWGSETVIMAGAVKNTYLDGGTWTRDGGDVRLVGGLETFDATYDDDDTKIEIDEFRIGATNTVKVAYRRDPS